MGMAATPLGAHQAMRAFAGRTDRTGVPARNLPKLARPLSYDSSQANKRLVKSVTTDVVCSLRFGMIRAPQYSFCKSAVAADFYRVVAAPIR
jgi:hypothetical protein